MFARILHAHDGTDEAFRALKVAVGLASRCQAELHMICVERPPRALAAGEGDTAMATPDLALRGAMIRAKALARLGDVDLIIHLLEGRPTKTIAEFAIDNRHDLLVIGQAAYAAFYDGVLGGVAERLMRMVPCPVLIVK
jgi:nucleotide-binding universal stress UspA family protein